MNSFWCGSRNVFANRPESELHLERTNWVLKGESKVEWHLCYPLRPNPNTAPFTKPFLSPFKLQKSPSRQAFCTTSLAFKTYLDHCCMHVSVALTRVRTQLESWVHVRLSHGAPVSCTALQVG